MFNRRIIASVCALALAVPATASALPAQDTATGKAQHVAYGDTKYDLQNQTDLGVPTGDTKNDLPQATTAPVPAPAAKPADDGTDGWLIAAIAAGGVLAAMFAAAGVALTRTRRGPAGLGA